jgi:hypothetical protein
LCYFYTNEENNNLLENPCKTQQETTLYSRNEDLVLAFPGLAPPIARKESIPYSVLVPLTKELGTVLEGNCSVKELEQY